MRRRIYGISESLSRALEWKTRGGQMIRKVHSPALRATDWKCPKYVWYVYETGEGDREGSDKS